MWFGRLAFLIALIFGLAGAQLPEFAQQYEQRLGGALDEVRRALSDFDAQAQAQGLDRTAGVARLQANSDPLARERGDDVLRLETRERVLSRDLQLMRSSGPFGQLAVAAVNLDPGVASATLRSFRPAAPLTAEGVTTGLFGFLFGLAACHGLAWPVRRRWRARRWRGSVGTSSV